MGGGRGLENDTISDLTGFFAGAIFSGLLSKGCRGSRRGGGGRAAFEMGPRGAPPPTNSSGSLSGDPQAAGYVFALILYRRRKASKAVSPSTGIEHFTEPLSYRHK